VPKSRRPSSSRSRNKATDPTKPFKLGVPYDALKKFLARSLERDDIDSVIRATLDAGRERADIDYASAIGALHDLAAWAFDIAERDVRGWSEAEHRVRNARRFVLAGIRGYRARRVPYEDVLFTAGLLVRIFDDDLSLGMSEMISVFDALGLPTEVVPLVPRNASAASALRPSPSPRSPISPSAALRPPATPVAEPASLIRCNECGHVHAPLWPHLRNAA